MTKRIIALVLLVWAGAAMAVSCSDKGPEEKHSIIFAENPVMAGASAGDFEVAIVADAEWKASSADSWICILSRVFLHRVEASQEAHAVLTFS